MDLNPSKNKNMYYMVQHCKSLYCKCLFFQLFRLNLWYCYTKQQWWDFLGQSQTDGQRLIRLLFRTLSSYRHYKCSESKKEVESSPGMWGEPFVLLLNQSIKWFFRSYQQNSFSSSWQTLWSTFNQTPETSNRTSITTWMMPLQSFPNCKQVSMSMLGNSCLIAEMFHCLVLQDHFVCVDIGEVILIRSD